MMDKQSDFDEEVVNVIRKRTEHIVRCPLFITPDVYEGIKKDFEALGVELISITHRPDQDTWDDDWRGYEILACKIPRWYYFTVNPFCKKFSWKVSEYHAEDVA